MSERCALRLCQGNGKKENVLYEQLHSAYTVSNANQWWRHLILKLIDHVEQITSVIKPARCETFQNSQDSQVICKLTIVANDAFIQDATLTLMG